MDSFSSFRDTSMVFHAPAQRRAPDTRVLAAPPPPPPPPVGAPVASTVAHLTRRSARPMAGTARPLPSFPTMLSDRKTISYMAEPDAHHHRSRQQHLFPTTSRQAPTGSGSGPPFPAPAYPNSLYPPTKTPLTYMLTSGPPTRYSPLRTSARPAAAPRPRPVAAMDTGYRVVRSEFPPVAMRCRLASDSSGTTASSSHSGPPSPISLSTSAPTSGAMAPQNDQKVATEATDKKKRKARICTTDGCTKYVVDHGLCIRHGGGKRCYIEGCDCRAQNRGLCWKHGGFTICKVDGCTKRAKSRGICWSHGGGTRCKRDDCSKIAVSNGLCWAHGGGKRCVFGDCRKPASERTNNFCNEHFAGAHDDDDEEQEL